MNFADFAGHGDCVVPTCGLLSILIKATTVSTAKTAPYSHSTLNRIW